MPNPRNLSFAVPAFDSFKNYDYEPATISISGTVAVDSTGSYTATVNLRRSNAIVSAQFSTIVNSTSHATGRVYAFLPNMRIDHADGSTATSPGTAAYNIFFENEFLGDTVVVKASLPNPYGEILTVVTETLSFDLYSFIAPFAT
jgi:hypothetical protein